MRFPDRDRLLEVFDGAGFLGAWAGGERPRVEEGALERYSDERWNGVIDIDGGWGLGIAD